MTKIESTFNDTFSHWEIRLPPSFHEHPKKGKIVQEGWAIWYLFGSDERGDYLDYYASHRMTDDRHVRIRADGACDDLPTISDVRWRSEDPLEDARLEAEYHAENRTVASMLEEKGFGLAGDEPSAIQINRLLQLRKLEE